MSEYHKQDCMNSPKMEIWTEVTQMSEIKLKPCPFCGGEAYYRTPTHLKGTAFDVMMVECKQCGASPYAVEVYEYNTEANKRKGIAEFWNRRADTNEH